MKKSTTMWSFSKSFNNSTAKHETFAGHFNISDYLVSEQSGVTREQVASIGNSLKFNALNEEVFADVTLAFQRYIDGHSRFVNGPLKSQFAKDMKRLNSNAESICKTLGSISSDENYLNTFAEELEKNNFCFYLTELKKIMDRLKDSTDQYLNDYVPFNSRPRENYVYEFIFLIGVAYQRWSGKKPSVSWHEHSNKFSSEFIDFVEAFFSLFKSTHVKTNFSIGQVIEIIDFSEIEQFFILKDVK